MPYITHDDLDNWFTYHPAKGNQPDKYDMLRQKAKELAEVIVLCCPECADTIAAVHKLRETLMAAILAIACNTKDV